MKILCSFLIYLPYILCYYVNNRDNSVLRSIIVIYRHGDKTPTQSFPRDGYFNEINFPRGFGDLTNKGKLRQYELGKWLRQNYTFLPDEYHPADIQVISTDTDRTLMSAASHLAGLYPPKGGDVWNTALPWQPIPIHTKSQYGDVFYKHKSCNNFIKLYKELDNVDFFKQINSENADLYGQISVLTGWPVDDLNYFARLYSVLYTYTNHNMSFLPEWYGTLNMTYIEHLAALHYTRTTYTKDLTRLSYGSFFYNVLQHFDDVIRSSKNDSTKILMFSAHQKDVASILNSLGAFDMKMPNFASMIIMELYENRDGFYINLKYKFNETNVNLLSINGCHFNCQYKQLKNILEPISLLPSERLKVCG